MIRNQFYSQKKLFLAKLMRKRMTPAEKVFWQAVKGNKVKGLHFRRQQIIKGFIADFYCDKLKLVVEIDGGIHESQKDYDAERDKVIKDHEIRVIRFTNQDVLNDIATIIKQLESI